MEPTGYLSFGVALQLLSVRHRLSKLLGLICDFVLDRRQADFAARHVVHGSPDFLQTFLSVRNSSVGAAQLGLGKNDQMCVGMRGEAEQQAQDEHPDKQPTRSHDGRTIGGRCDRQVKARESLRAGHVVF